MLSLHLSLNRILSTFGMPYRPRHHQACGPRLPRRAVLVHATAAGAAAGDPSDREALVKGDVGDPAQAQSIPGPATQLGQVSSATHLLPGFTPLQKGVAQVWRVPGGAEAYVFSFGGRSARSRRRPWSPARSWSRCGAPSCPRPAQLLQRGSAWQPACMRGQKFACCETVAARGGTACGDGKHAIVFLDRRPLCQRKGWAVIKMAC